MSEPVDVLVIGAGPSGAIAAGELAAHGFSVTCLEQGDWVRRTEFLGTTPSWEMGAQRVWNPDPNVRRLSADYPVDVVDSDVDPLMFSGVGGSTVLYGAQWVRMLPSDFRVRTMDGVADDWPLTYEDLAPYYDRTDQLVGVSGLAGDPGQPGPENYPMAPLPIGKVGRKAAEGMNALGWHWWPGPNAIASRRYGDLSPCVRRGVCETGCPEGAKASADLALWPRALSNGVKLVTGARVLEITTDSRGLATGAVYVDRNRVPHHQRAGVVILAANGIGTPRLLQLSASKAHPNGLANSSGLVGRRLMMHPLAAVRGIYDEHLESWLGPAGQPLISTQFYETDASRGFVRGAKWQAMPTGGPLRNGTGHEGWRPRGSELDPSVDARSWGVAFHDEVERAFGHSFEWSIIAEDLPEEHNRVVLSDSLIDTDGLAAPKLIYKTSTNTRALLEFHVARAAEAHRASGATEVYEVPLVRESGWHLMGTTRMGTDPETSVTDPYGRTHDVPNLVIVDGSTFVTSSGMNPTSTIVALALRTAEHLIAARREQVTA